MDLNKFIQLRENLYHLTDEQNLPNILNGQKLLSTAQLTRSVNMKDANTFLRARRVGHKEISDGKFKVKLRDQDPLYEKIVVKNLEADGHLAILFIHLIHEYFFGQRKKIYELIICDTKIKVSFLKYYVLKQKILLKQIKYNQNFVT